MLILFEEWKKTRRVQHRNPAGAGEAPHSVPPPDSNHKMLPFLPRFNNTMLEQVVDEIYSYCDHVAPWAPGTSRVPSSAFCLLMKLFVMRLTRPQMNEILVHEVCAGLCRPCLSRGLRGGRSLSVQRVSVREAFYALESGARSPPTPHPPIHSLPVCVCFSIFCRCLRGCRLEIFSALVVPPPALPFVVLPRSLPCALVPCHSSRHERVFQEREHLQAGWYPSAPAKATSTGCRPHTHALPNPPPRLVSLIPPSRRAVLSARGWLLVTLPRAILFRPAGWFSSRPPRHERSQDSPFIRAIGFLYLRYTCPPKVRKGLEKAGRRPLALVFGCGSGQSLGWASRTAAVVWGGGRLFCPPSPWALPAAAAFCRFH